MNIEELKEKHENLRNILIEYNCEEFGDCIIDDISILFDTEPTTTYPDKLEKLKEEYKNSNSDYEFEGWLKYIKNIVL